MLWYNRCFRCWTFGNLSWWLISMTKLLPFGTDYRVWFSQVRNTQNSLRNVMMWECNVWGKAAWRIKIMWLPMGAGEAVMVLNDCRKDWRKRLLLGEAASWLMSNFLTNEFLERVRGNAVLNVCGLILEMLLKEWLSWEESPELLWCDFLGTRLVELVVEALLTQSGNVGCDWRRKAVGSGSWSRSLWD
jgi:hypothetical protein